MKLQSSTSILPLALTNFSLSRMLLSQPCGVRALTTSSLCRHFQCGVSNFLLGRYNAAYANFEDAFLYLRGNPAMYVLHDNLPPPFTSVFRDIEIMNSWA